MGARRGIARGTVWALLGLAVAAGSAAGKPPAAPEPKVVGHWLPFPADVAYKCWQGNDQGPTHNDEWNKYAFDFSPMAIGSDVCASADGIVVFVKEDTEGPTNDFKDNNEVSVLHEDGTVSTYVHLMKDGALVDVDQRVYAGDLIGKSGNTGKSGGAHLHFGLREGTRMGKSLPCRFLEVPGDGVPKTGDLVTSKNARGGVLQAVFDRVAAQYDVATKAEALSAMLPRLQPFLGTAVPAECAAILATFAGRKDIREIYETRRTEALERWRADAKAVLEAVAAAKEAGDVATAVALASRGRADFAPLDDAAKFQAELTAMKADPAYGKAAQSVVAPLGWARELCRAFDAEAKAREKSAKGKPGGWKAVLEGYEGALRRAPSPAARETLDAYVAPLRREFGSAR
jgi:hypothetical protein